MKGHNQLYTKVLQLNPVKLAEIGGKFEIPLLSYNFDTKTTIPLSFLNRNIENAIPKNAVITNISVNTKYTFTYKNLTDEEVTQLVVHIDAFLAMMSGTSVNQTIDPTIVILTKGPSLWELIDMMRVESILKSDPTGNYEPITFRHEHLQYIDLVINYTLHH